MIPDNPQYPGVFEEVERDLYQREDELILLIKKPEKTNEDSERIKLINDEIATDWVKYTRLPRHLGIPKHRVAIKHVAVLRTKHTTYFETELKYGREEEHEKENRVVVPVLDISKEPVIATVADNTRIIPYRIYKGQDEYLSLQVISSCGACPAGGKCDLVDRCSAHNTMEYNSLRTRFTPGEPVRDDYAAFESYARRVKA